MCPIKKDLKHYNILNLFSVHAQMGSETVGYPAATMKLLQLKEVKLTKLLHLYPGSLSNWPNSNHMVILKDKSLNICIELFFFF